MQEESDSEGEASDEQNLTQQGAPQEREVRNNKVCYQELTHGVAKVEPCFVSTVLVWKCRPID
jgi:hypothetical protein